MKMQPFTTSKRVDAGALFCAALACGALWVSASGAAGVREGQWSLTIITRGEGVRNDFAAGMQEIEGMSPNDAAKIRGLLGGAGASPTAGGANPITLTQCLSNDNPVPQLPGTAGCKLNPLIVGETVTFEGSCPNGSSSGEINYKEDSLSGRVKWTQWLNGQETNTTVEITGVYAGPCP